MQILLSLLTRQVILIPSLFLVECQEGHPPCKNLAPAVATGSVGDVLAAQPNLE